MFCMLFYFFQLIEDLSHDDGLNNVHSAFNMLFICLGFYEFHGIIVLIFSLEVIK